MTDKATEIANLLAPTVSSLGVELLGVEYLPSTGGTTLRLYIDMERGDLYLALGRYNGSRGRPEYPNAVYAAARNWIHPDA